MSEQIREQVSAFLDGELPGSETELLLKRLMRDAELRESFGRYALIGEGLRGGSPARLTQGFAGRVNRAINGEEPMSGNPQAVPERSVRWWRPLTGAAVAAGVAVVAVVALQQRAIAPTPGAGSPITAQIMEGGANQANRSMAQGGAVAQNAVLTRPLLAAGTTEPGSYVVPPTVSEAPAAMPMARLTNYVFAHSKYSSVLGQNDVLNDLLTYADSENAAEPPRDPRTAP